MHHPYDISLLKCESFLASDYVIKIEERGQREGKRTSSSCPSEFIRPPSIRSLLEGPATEALRASKRQRIKRKSLKNSIDSTFDFNQAFLDLTKEFEEPFPQIEWAFDDDDVNKTTICVKDDKKIMECENFLQKTISNTHMYPLRRSKTMSHQV